MLLSRHTWAHTNLEQGRCLPTHVRNRDASALRITNLLLMYKDSNEQHLLMIHNNWNPDQDLRHCQKLRFDPRCRIAFPSP